ncbi:hypothetical protein MIMGU_mgv1a012063mg [Erythranthe guttata]|uniref:Glutaredoxin domain-containing protein n=1 Tax=Erythranthe guttata TaxID=4155 RepID=A0A022RVJ3_ERYGU|nr:hypothetical protein MIMGU_mgv1a012063mg [Erythranthe guttata]
MADRKNQGAGTKPQINTKINNPNSVFNRSMTVNYSSSEAAAAAASVNKPLYNLSTSAAFQRNGSIKSLYSSPFGSMVSAGNSFRGKTSPLPSPKSTPDAISQNTPDPSIRLPGSEDRIVIYFTSLRGIRRTFQDCHSIRMIFRGFRVNVDERDISMDIAYKKELQKVLGQSSFTLPQVFVKGKYIGGADVVKQFLETGELAKMVKGIPLRAMGPCEGCDDMRFLPCANCSGSRKVFDEDDELVKRCSDCNENGLVRCPLCCS